jgi:hypothetical protein
MHKKLILLKLNSRLFLTLRLENLKNKKARSNVLFEFDKDCKKLQKSLLILGLLNLFRDPKYILQTFCAKNRVFCVLCQPKSILTNTENLFFLFKNIKF